MKGKIGLEEHFAIDDTLNDSKGFFPDNIWTEVRERILDLHGRRLRLMDEFGMQMMILSLNAPAVQAIPDPRRANEIARRANDFLAEQVRKRPERFQALAALPMQDPDLASKELQRCVQDLRFKGALVNGFSQINQTDSAVYYDLPQYWPFWGVVEALDSQADERTFCGVGRQQRRVRVALLEVLHDRRRLRQHERVLLEHRHAAGRIQLVDPRGPVAKIDRDHLMLDALLREHDSDARAVRTTVGVVERDHGASPMTSATCS